MEVTARLRHLQSSPQKVRLVADLIRGKGAEEAVAILQQTKKRAARPLEKLVQGPFADILTHVGQLAVRPSQSPTPPVVAPGAKPR